MKSRGRIIDGIEDNDIIKVRLLGLINRLFPGLPAEGHGLYGGNYRHALR